jgi:formylglycine-generating enzyme required for sulfatase activity
MRVICASENRQGYLCPRCCTVATITTDQANFNADHSYGGGSEGVYRKKTVAVGTVAPNRLGLHDMHGNV